MNLKELNTIGEKCLNVDTGYMKYSNTIEIWKDGYYHGKVTEFYVSSLGRVYNKFTNKYSKIFKNDSGYLYCQSYYKY